LKLIWKKESMKNINNKNRPASTSVFNSNSGKNSIEVNQSLNMKQKENVERKNTVIINN